MKSAMVAFASFVLIGLTTAPMAWARPQAPQQAAGAFKIVVIAGEDAVNIIQQKTAVAPIVEVRDRNNLPVAGVPVTFTIGGGSGASFGGLSTLTVTTNAAGQAAAAGFTPTAAGAIQINASALVQGQALTATIAQTNVMTAAEAATAGGAAGSGGGASGGGSSGAAGGAGGGAGGGMSGAMIGVIGGVVGAGALVGVAAAGGGDESTPTSTAPTTPPVATTPPTTTPAPAPTPTPTTSTPSGSISGTYNETVTSGTGGFNFSCTIVYPASGTVRLTLETRTDGTVSGTGTVNFVLGASTFQCNIPLTDVPGDVGAGSIPFTGPITGTSGSLRFSQDITQNSNEQGFTISSRITMNFTGSASGGVVTGTLTVTDSTSVDGLGIVGRGTGTGTYQMVLR